jgi:hypothetical protein
LTKQKLSVLPKKTKAHKPDVFERIKQPSNAGWAAFFM